MIQGFTISPITADICTEDNRIDTTVASTQIRFLVKFINDLDGSIVYCYPDLDTGIKPRYTDMTFQGQKIPDMFQGQIYITLAGHWKYEIYEVSWIGAIVLSLATAPATETTVLAVADTNGVVQGIVTKGILNLTEKEGTEQVQYTQHESAAGTNTIYYGQ